MLHRQASRLLNYSKLQGRYVSIKKYSNEAQTRALILGLHTPKAKSSDSNSTAQISVKEIKGTESFNFYNKKWNNELTDLVSIGNPLKAGQARTFYGKKDEFSAVTVVGIAESDPEIKSSELIDDEKENMRLAVAAGIKSYKDSGISSLHVDAAVLPLGAAEGAFLASWSYKEKERNKFPSTISPLQEQDEQEWNVGKVYADCQNFARFLMESPANLMTPTLFAENVSKAFEDAKTDTKGSIEVFVRDREWIEMENMGAFLSVSNGSDEPPKFVEIHYKSENFNGGDPLVLVGKGVTFDCGGVSIKPSQAMDEMRADMGGAATVTSAILGACKLNAPGHIIGLIPLCENMVNGKATKPGDVVTARNGTQIQVDNTDAEGRLLLADALLYGQDFKPTAILNAATLTGAIVVALGTAVTGVYSNNELVWNQLQNAGQSTGDRMWRMPLLKHYSSQVKPSQLADINNVGTGGRGGGSCTAAAFLHHFVDEGVKWAHLDIAGVMSTNGSDLPYLCKGMAGRPTRTLLEFIRNYES